MKLAEGIIHGTLESKSNSRRVVKRGAKPMMIKSDKARAYVESAVAQLRSLKARMGWPTFKQDVSLAVLVHYPDRRRDLDIELFCDCLQQAEIIANDRQIVEKHSCCTRSMEEPHLIFVLRDSLSDQRLRAAAFTGEFL